MMMKTRLLKLRPVAILLAASVATALSGCDMGTYGERVEQAGANYQAPVEPTQPASGEKEMDKPSPVVGTWMFDSEATNAATASKVNALMGGGPAAREARARAMSATTMDFDLKADGTFTCREVMGAESADYKGSWSLSRDKIDLKQTHRDGKPEKDLLSGTLRGNTMDLIHKEGSINYPFVLKRR